MKNAGASLFGPAGMFFSDKGKETLKTAKETFVNPLGKEFARPFVSAISGLTGKKTATSTPFGEVKPYTEVSGGEAAMGTIDLLSTVLPVEKLAAPVAKTAGRLFPKLGTKAAETLAGVSPEVMQTLKESPEGVRSAQKLLDQGEDIFPSIGKDIFDTAKKVYKTAQETWQSKETEMLSKAASKIKDLKPLPDRISLTLQNEGIKTTEKGLDFLSSKFAQNPTAENALNRIHSILQEPSQSLEVLLNKRSAISNIQQSIPKNESNVRRVVGNVVKDFDAVLDDLTEGGSSALRSEYAKSVGPVKEAMAKLTDKKGNFSMDKGRLFVKQLMSDAKFDNTELIKKVDALAGSNFIDDVKNLGAARAIDKLTPDTGARIKDVLISYGVAKVPFLSALVSPKFWGEITLKGAEKAAKDTTKDALTGLILQNMLLRGAEKLYSED